MTWKELVMPTSPIPFLFSPKNCWLLQPGFLALMLMGHIVVKEVNTLEIPEALRSPVARAVLCFPSLPPTALITEQTYCSFPWKSLPRTSSPLLRLVHGMRVCSFFFFFLRFYLFLDSGEGREKERERNINVWLLLGSPLMGTWPTTQACALTGNRTGDPLVLSPVLNTLSHTSQVDGVFLI